MSVDGNSAADPLKADPRILVAEDDLVSRRVVETLLRKWGYEVVLAGDGLTALDILCRPDAPRLALLDWMMPGLDGPDVCRKVRANACRESPYLLLLTARGSKDDVIVGLRSGADDYLTKPFDRRELEARLQVGRRILALQRSLADRVHDLERALAQVQQLQGLLPICCYCKKIRDDHNYWQRVEEYLGKHSGARFSHSICPDCWEKEIWPQFTSRGEAPPPFPGGCESEEAVAGNGR